MAQGAATPSCTSSPVDKATLTSRESPAFPLAARPHEAGEIFNALSPSPMSLATFCRRKASHNHSSSSFLFTSFPCTVRCRFRTMTSERESIFGRQEGAPPLLGGDFSPSGATLPPRCERSSLGQEPLPKSEYPLLNCPPPGVNPPQGVSPFGDVRLRACLPPGSLASGRVSLRGCPPPDVSPFGDFRLWARDLRANHRKPPV